MVYEAELGYDPDEWEECKDEKVPPINFFARALLATASILFTMFFFWLIEARKSWSAREKPVEKMTEAVEQRESERQKEQPSNGVPAQNDVHLQRETDIAAFGDEEVKAILDERHEWDQEVATLKSEKTQSVTLTAKPLPVKAVEGPIAIVTETAILDGSTSPIVQLQKLEQWEDDLNKMQTLKVEEVNKYVVIDAQGQQQQSAVRMSENRMSEPRLFALGITATPPPTPIMYPPFDEDQSVQVDENAIKSNSDSIKVKESQSQSSSEKLDESFQQLAQDLQTKLLMEMDTLNRLERSHSELAADKNVFPDGVTSENDVILMAEKIALKKDENQIVHLQEISQQITETITADQLNKLLVIKNESLQDVPRDNDLMQSVFPKEGQPEKFGAFLSETAKMEKIISGKELATVIDHLTHIKAAGGQQEVSELANQLSSEKITQIIRNAENILYEGKKAQTGETKVFSETAEEITEEEKLIQENLEQILNDIKRSDAQSYPGIAYDGQHMVPVKHKEEEEDDEGFVIPVIYSEEYAELPADFSLDSQPPGAFSMSTSQETAIMDQQGQYSEQQDEYNIPIPIRFDKDDVDISIPISYEKGTTGRDHLDQQISGEIISQEKDFDIQIPIQFEESSKLAMEPVTKLNDYFSVPIPILIEKTDIGTLSDEKSAFEHYQRPHGIHDYDADSIPVPIVVEVQQPTIDDHQPYVEIDRGLHLPEIDGQFKQELSKTDLSLSEKHKQQPSVSPKSVEEQAEEYIQEAIEYIYRKSPSDEIKSLPFSHVILPAGHGAGIEQLNVQVEQLRRSVEELSENMQQQNEQQQQQQQQQQQHASAEWAAVHEKSDGDEAVSPLCDFPLNDEDSIRSGTFAPDIESVEVPPGDQTSVSDFEMEYDLKNGNLLYEQKPTREASAPALWSASRPLAEQVQRLRRSPSNHSSASRSLQSTDNSKSTKVRKQSSLMSTLGVTSMQEMLLTLTSLNELSVAMRKAGLKSSNLIFGIDYTASNKYQGEYSFGGKSLHSIEPNLLNPYQQVITIMGKTLAPFATSGHIPAFGFGDATTSDWSVFALNQDGQSMDFDQVLRVYNEITPSVRLSGPTNFAPLIHRAIDICRRVRDYHILVIVADGQVTNERATQRAIVEACHHPLSIIVVGVGDGPWDMMRVFDDSLPKRPWDNFHFVEFGEISKKSGKDFDLSFAVQSLLEVPDQYRHICELGLVTAPAPRHQY